MTGPCTGSLLSKLPASGDELCRADKTVSPRRRSRASPSSTFAELRELWCRLYKTATAPRLGRELLMRAVAYRMQELAAGGLRPELQRQLQQIARELPQTGRVTIRPAFG